MLEVGMAVISVRTCFSSNKLFNRGMNGFRGIRVSVL